MLSMTASTFVTYALGALLMISGQRCGAPPGVPRSLPMRGSWARSVCRTFLHGLGLVLFLDVHVESVEVSLRAGMRTEAINFRPCANNVLMNVGHEAIEAVRQQRRRSLL